MLASIPFAVRIIMALDKRFLESINQQGSVEWIPRWMEEDEIFDVAVASYAENDEEVNNLKNDARFIESFRHTMRLLRRARLIVQFGKKPPTWLVERMGGSYYVLALMKIGDEFERDDLAFWARKSGGWASVRLKALEELKIVKSVGVNRYRRIG